MWMFMDLRLYGSITNLILKLISDIFCVKVLIYKRDVAYEKSSKSNYCWNGN